jgi:hypothetical protein
MKPTEEEWGQTDTLLAKYDQNNERTSGWNSQTDIVRWKISENSNYKSDTIWVKLDIVQ